MSRFEIEMFASHNDALKAKNYDRTRHYLSDNIEKAVIYYCDSHSKWFMPLEVWLWHYHPEVFNNILEPRDVCLDESGLICCICDFGASGAYLPISTYAIYRDLGFTANLRKIYEMFRDKGTIHKWSGGDYIEYTSNTSISLFKDKARLWKWVGPCQEEEVYITDLDLLEYLRFVLKENGYEGKNIYSE